jgi:death-on-curing protein
VIYLSTQQVLFIHMRVVEETGGDPRLCDLGLLKAAVARPRAAFAAADLYPDALSKAAALLESLVRNHPFVDGNKRTGIAAATLFLLRNGQRLNIDNVELERFTLAVARSELTVGQVAAWLRIHCAPQS